MIYEHEVTITLGNSSHTQLSNFDEYEIVLDMFSPANPWACTLWYSGENDSAWRAMLNQARLGEKVQIAIDGALQLNGRIEKRDIVCNRDHGTALVISGRDLAGPAVDWDADPRTRLYKRTLAEALEDLFRPLGIPVVIGANADAAREVQTRQRPGARGSTSAQTTANGRHHRKHRRNKVDLSHPRPGERIWQVMESILHRMGFMAWVAPSANGELAVVIDVPNYNQDSVYHFKRRIENGEVTLDSDILDSTLEAQIRDIPTVVYAYGHAPRGDTKPARTAVGMSRRSVFARPLYDDSGFWARSGLPDGFDTPPDMAYEGPRFGPPPEQAAAIIRAFSDVTSAALTATSPTQPTAARAPISARMPFQNAALARFGETALLVVSPLPPQPRFLHTKRALSPATGEQEAKHHIAYSMRRFRQYMITVQGHGQMVDGSMRLYAINTMAQVYDRISEMDQEDMLITRVAFKRSRKAGTITELTLGTRGMIVLTPEDVPIVDQENQPF